MGFKPGHGYDRFVAEHAELAKPRFLGELSKITEERIVEKVVEKVVLQEVEKIVVQEQVIERLPEIIGWRQIASYARKRISHYFKE